MSDTLYIIFVVILIFVIILQYAYIRNLKRAIEYAVRMLEKYKDAILMDEIIERVTKNESKTDKTVHE